MKLAYERKLILGAAARSTVDIFPTEEGVMFAIEHEGHRLVALMSPDEARAAGIGIIEAGAAVRAQEAAKAIAVASPALAPLVGIDGGKKH